MSFPLRVPFFMLLLLAIASPSVSAQSQSELRRENERLRAEIVTLTRELEVAVAQVERLERELATALAGKPATVSGPDPVPVTIDESIPSASPRALLSALMSDYLSTTASKDRGDGADDPHRVAYLRELHRWVLRMNREHKKPVEWHVRIMDTPVPAGRGYAVRLQAVDPGTGAALGDPFDGLLPRTVRSRLQQLADRGQLGDVLIVKGTLVPRLVLNEERIEEGPFNNPRFVGAFVEFGFHLQVQALIHAPQEEDAKKRPRG